MQEVKYFSDFYEHIRRNPHELICPICASQVRAHILATFDMNQAGTAEFHCAKPSCDFNKTGFRVEAIPKTRGLR